MMCRLCAGNDASSINSNEIVSSILQVYVTFYLELPIGSCE